MVLAKLALSNFTTRKIRVALTVAAIALSVSLVVSVTSGYASVEASAFKFLSMYMGTHDAQLTRVGDLRGGINERICDELVADPDVKGILRRLEMESGLLDLNGKPIPGRPANIFGIKRPEDTRVERMTLEAGKWFDTSDGDGAVVDQAARIIKNGDSKRTEDDAPRLAIGDTLHAPQRDRQSSHFASPASSTSRESWPRSRRRFMSRWRRSRNSRCPISRRR